MPDTTNWDFPYPAGTDAPDVPTDMQELANRNEAVAEILAAAAGVSTPGSSVRRGKSIIATEETRTDTAYGTLTTPDQVTGVVVPTDGLIVVAYQAMWKESVNAAANAAIFLGANQLKRPSTGATTPQTQATALGAGSGDVYKAMTSWHGGLAGGGGSVGTAYAGDVSTGQALSTVVNADANGGPCHIVAAAGTYTVSVQFKSTSGSVTVKNRKLWVWTLGF